MEGTSASIGCPSGPQRAVPREQTAVDLCHTPRLIHGPGPRSDRSTERFFIGIASTGGVVVEHAMDDSPLAAS